LPNSDDGSDGNDADGDSGDADADADADGVDGDNEENIHLLYYILAHPRLEKQNTNADVM